MRKILRYLYKNLLPTRLSHSIDLFKNLRIPMTDGLNEKNVLVLSPHPDDDIIGCGGTLHIYHHKGAEITSIYMTDGRKGNPACDEDNLVAIRKEEAKKAATIIGIDRLIFLDNRDNELSPYTKTIAELSTILKDLKPEAVFLPFLLDNHPDHIATNDIFVQATKDYNDAIMCYGYEIWTPIASPNRIVDITREIETKKKAIEEHYGQISQSNIIDAFIGLSRYRAILHGLNNGYAEAFLQCSINEYRRLWRVTQWP